MKWFVAVLLAFGFCVVCRTYAGAVDQPNAFVNPGLEGPYQPLPAPAANAKARITGAVADGWEDNSSWADVTVVYAEDRTKPHEGEASQRIEVKEIRGGGVQFVHRIKVEKGHVYHAVVWLRGTTAAPVNIILRKAGAPYTAYVTATLSLTPEWQPVQLTGIAPESSDAYLMINPTGPCVMSVDDAIFEDVTDKVSAAPPHKGNMLPDASFETGITAGWSVRIRGANQPAVSARSEFADPHAVIDTTTATNGRQSLRIAIPDEMAALVASPLVPYNYGRAHSFSVAMKADQENVGVQLDLEGSSVQTAVRVGTQWRRYSVSGVLPYGKATRAWLRCWTGGVTLWVDAAQLEEAPKPSAEYHPAFPVEMGLFVHRPGSIVFDGESAPVTVTTAGPVPAGSRLRLSVTDVHGATSVLPDVKLPAASFAVPPDPARPRGVFRLHGELVAADGKRLAAPVDLVFARLPRPRDIAPERSFFGVHIPLAPEYFAIAHAIGAHWIRIHDASQITKWAIAEPERDHFQYFDTAVDAARASGLRILGMLDGAPAWASAKPRATSGYYAVYNMPDAPDAKERWANYVRHVVGHYRGKIDAWEVWNEPWGSFFPGTPEQYGELLKIAYAAAKEVNPNAVIVGIDAYAGHPEFTEGALRTAGIGSFDAFSYHDYNSSLYGGPTNNALREAELFRAAQRQYGAPKPLWVTEGGPGEIASFYAPAGSGLSPLMQVAHAVRFDVTMMAAGVRHFFYYTLHADPPSGATGFTALEHDRAIRPEMAARAVLASLVDGAKCSGRTEPVDGVDAYQFRQPQGGTVTVLWTYRGDTHTVPVPSGAHALDALGNPLPGKSIAVGVEPVYFVK